MASIGGRSPPGQNTPTGRRKAWLRQDAQNFVGLAQLLDFPLERPQPLALVSPARRPASRSACLTQEDNVCAVQPILTEIETIAARCDWCSPRCSPTIRTARSRTFGENIRCVDSFYMAPISQVLEPPANPGRFKATLKRVLLSLRPKHVRHLRRRYGRTQVEWLVRCSNESHRVGHSYWTLSEQLQFGYLTAPQRPLIFLCQTLLRHGPVALNGRQIEDLPVWPSARPG